MSQKFNTREIRILGDLSRLDKFLLNPQDQLHSGPIPETSRNSNRENQVMMEDRSQNDAHPKVGVSMSQSSQELGPEETSHNYSQTLVKIVNI